MSNPGPLNSESYNLTLGNYAPLHLLILGYHVKMVYLRKLQTHTVINYLFELNYFKNI